LLLDENYQLTALFMGGGAQWCWKRACHIKGQWWEVQQGSGPNATSWKNVSCYMFSHSHFFSIYNDGGVCVNHVEFVVDKVASG